MKDFYLDKQERLRQWGRGPYRIAAGLLAALALFLPVWRETISGRFVLEPEHRSVIRAAVPGQITKVLADEGMAVEAGSPLFILRNVRLEGEADDTRVGLRTADAQAREAQMTYANLGPARAEAASQASRSRSVLEKMAALEVASPISGVVATPRLSDRVGSFVQEGEELAEVDDARTLRARIFVPEFQIQRVRQGAPASLKLESLFQSLRGQVNSVASASADPAPGLLPEEKYKGIAQTNYYIASVLVSNPHGMLRPGMSGDAKIQVRRLSLIGFGLETIREALQRKIW